MADTEIKARPQAPGNEPKTEKTCPFCRGSILLRARQCKYCGGDVDAGTLQGDAWRSGPAIAGQLRMLKKIKIKVGRDLTAGEASDLLRTAWEGAPGAFEVLAGEGTRVRRRGGAGFLKFVAFLLIVGGGAWALNHFGLLQPMLDHAKTGLVALRDRMKEAPTPEQEKPYVPEKDPVTLVDTDEPKPPPEPETAPVPGKTQPAAGTPQDSPLAAKYRSIYRQPPAGTDIIVVLTNQQAFYGIVKEITPEGIKLLRGKATVEFEKKHLAPQTQALLYEDDYVAYCVTRHNEYVAWQEQQAQVTAQKPAPVTTAAKTSSTSAYGERPPPPKIFSRTTARRPVSAGEREAQTRTSSAGTSSQSVPLKTASGRPTAAARREASRMSMAEWMEKYNQDNQRLLQRQQRIKEAESKMHAQGVDI